MFERFTDRARKVMQLANQEAQRWNHEYIGTEHLLIGLIKEGNGVAANVLMNLDVDLRKLRLEVEKFVQSGPEMVTMGKLPQTPRAKNVIEFSMEEARKLHHNYVGTEHILLGLLREGEGVAAKVLASLGLRLDDVRNEVLNLLGHGVEGAADRALPGLRAAHRRQVDFSDAMLLRTLDAAANRAGEGLRVVEDYLRFILDDRHLTEVAKNLRHDLSAAVSELPTFERLTSRNTSADVGTDVKTLRETQRTELDDVLHANFQRSFEALRSLEEFSKLPCPALAAKFEKLRYRAYDLHRSVGIAATLGEGHPTRIPAAARLASAKLYVLVEGGRSTAKFGNLIDALIAGGVHVIQLRDKKLNDRELLGRARLLGTKTRGTETLFIMNDRPDLAALSHADGVHVGQDELSVKDARAIVGPRALIGVSTHSIEQARQAVLDGANYIGVGPVFSTETKQFDKLAGVALVRAIADEIKLPAFAIGGITLDNIADVLAAGATRVAVSGAIVNSPDPKAEVRELLERLEIS
jgi:thiamine-phosphate pyrophosphorylase